jgi:hypothetical protein
MTLVKYDENGNPPPPEFLDALEQFRQGASAAGAMTGCGGLEPSAMGSRHRLSREKVSTTDGPFTETKELIGGYAIYETKSKQEVTEWISRFLGLHKYWPQWECEVEVRQIMEEPDEQASASNPQPRISS